MWDGVSDGEIRRSLAELGVRFPEANRYLRSVRLGDMSLRDAVYFTLLAAAERDRRRDASNREVTIA